MAIEDRQFGPTLRDGGPAHAYLPHSEEGSYPRLIDFASLESRLESETDEKREYLPHQLAVELHEEEKGNPRDITVGNAVVT